MGLFDVFEGGKEVVGGLVDGATELLGGGLRAVGLDSIATNVEDFGDDVANSLGAMPDEKNLDETKDPKELILGAPAGITALADKFTGFAGNFVAAALARVGMSEFRKRQIGELSGGQKKRVFLARALAQDGKIILLDEPFTGVDVRTEDSIIALLRALRDDLVIDDLRGNVNSRLAKLDAGEYAAIILACAGLARLGFEGRIRARLDAPDWLPAPAQGAIAIECRDGDAGVHALLAALDDADTRTCVGAERAMNRALDGSCHVPVAALARLDGDRLHLQGLVGSATTGEQVRADARGGRIDAETLGEVVAVELLAQGARAFID